MGDFRMPSLGADMEKGTILEWRVAPGDAVHRGDVVAVVDTDKSDIEIETFETGTIGALLVPVGEEVPVGAVIATIVAPGAEPPAPAPVTPAPAPVAPAPPAPPRPARRRPATAPGGARPPVSPRARRLADELHVDLTTITAEAGGRPVTGDDIRRRRDQRPRVAAHERPRAAADAVGRLMERSKREIPHFYVSEDVDVTAALEWMEHRNASAPIAERLVPAALLLRAVVVALRDVPELNGHVVDGVPAVIAPVHLAVAVSQRDGGLIAPVIRDASALELGELMAAMRDLVGRVRSGSLRSSDVTDATITVTNLGDQGCDAVFGVIVPPQIAIVGLGRVVERPWAVDGMLTVRKVVTATLSADHRASHGHRGGHFLRALAHALENPEVLA
jgi:pyruvate dehydrogenase E2 component (dihydrolipoamide acetyltransferase)